MHLIFPCSVLKPHLPDEMFEEQQKAFKAAGFSTSLVALEGNLRITSPVPHGETVVYRGWMLVAEDYERLVQTISSSGSVPLTTTKDYLLTHHLPNWYPLIADLTPETRVFPASANLEEELSRLGWERFFLKDYVKSVKTSVGSTIDSPSKASLIVSEMKKYRGVIEGGFCVRRVEEFVPGTETRYFVIHGRPYAADPTHEIPTIIRLVGERIPSRFFSVDVVMRTDGKQRVVEVGDGQVSDIVGWTANRLAAVWREAIE